MPTLKSRTDLPEDVLSRLVDLRKRVRMLGIARKLRMEAFTDEERGLVEETRDGFDQLIQTFAEIRGLSLERAVIELALEATSLDYVEYRKLRSKIGEPIDESKTKKIPTWESKTGELFFNGEVVRKVSLQAKNVRVVLDTFQEDGWPSSIDNPITGGADSSKLRDTVRNLNHNLLGLRFYSYNFAKGIRWEVVI